jgi:hypothetical protein
MPAGDAASPPGQLSASQLWVCGVHRVHSLVVRTDHNAVFLYTLVHIRSKNALASIKCLAIITQANRIAIVCSVITRIF